MLQEALQSPFILSSLQSTQWENRNYIESLIRLFRFMKKQRLSPAEGQVYFLLRNKYPEAYMHLLKELDPLKYQLFIEEQEQLINKRHLEQDADKKRQQQWVEEERRDFELWNELKNGTR